MDGVGEEMGEEVQTQIYASTNNAGLGIWQQLNSKRWYAPRIRQDTSMGHLYATGLACKTALNALNEFIKGKNPRRMDFKYVYNETGQEPINARKKLKRGGLLLSKQCVSDNCSVDLRRNIKRLPLLIQICITVRAYKKFFMMRKDVL